MPFYVFTIGGALVVLGFTFRVIQVTSGLTEMKDTQAGIKFRNIGIICLIAGLVIGIVGLTRMISNEKIAMMTVGGDIVALGISTLVQYKLNSRNRTILKWTAWGLVIVGLAMWIAYELVLFIGALQGG